ncbi:hypothetical protein B9Q04_00270 [Candidatus Marsarchaeota G2 archaeon BE_D]|uniref:Type 4 fimbrial biogenesis protein PilX N-terminal domain-containing protein n=3 Tax=Candidatus Marsarchaeota group 2 TaxID=2203771 RepID=A0A2R6CEZ5_9ARCH|nr:MAG: hypothetical protein B9Q06_00650 [Candidatus Marsarchaeota G2 archaeon ECH_B_2]PSO03391.1 MAG: hypothetical protein B9Q05_00650 [Candidatus Marsarchaeota G2 archaeon ECH_B_1]PSO09459.1 MAG: hypothetical protein B9Q04_00270 [Candidatus Marsarchaeota G2 archaeon BE_D]
MADVVIGNVILTATLVVALLLFVASASGLATIYTIRVRQSLLQNQATQVAQLIQQVYLIVNTTQIPSNTNYVLKSLGLPNQLDGYPYTLTLSTTQTTTGLVSITVKLTLTATYGQASSTVLLGKNFALAKNPSTTLGATTISAQLYKCAGSIGGQTAQGSACTGQPAGEVVLQLEGGIYAG